MARSPVHGEQSAADATHEPDDDRESPSEAPDDMERRELRESSWERELEAQGMAAFAASDAATWARLRESGATDLAVSVQRQRFDRLLRIGNEAQVLAEFLDPQFTRDATYHDPLAVLHVRALGVLVWQEPTRALQLLEDWQGSSDPELADLTLTIEANAYLVPTWNRVCDTTLVPAPLLQLVRYAHVVSNHTHAELLAEVGKDLQTHVLDYTRLCDRLVESGDLKVMDYIESLGFSGHTAPIDHIGALADADSDLRQELAAIADTASSYTPLSVYGPVLLVVGLVVVVYLTLGLELWLGLAAALLYALIALSTRQPSKSKRSYYAQKIRPQLARAYARHGCEDHELIVAWIRMSARASGLYPFFSHFRFDRALRLIGVLGAGARVPAP